MTSHGLAGYGTFTLGVVTDNDDPESRGRVKVRLSAIDVELWAVVAVPSAGNGYGVSLLPRKDEVVVVGFISPELPIVIGSVWAGSSPLPSDAAPVEKRYSITTPAGTVLLFDDEDGPQLKVTTPAGNKFQLTDDSGGKALIDVQGTKITITSSKVEIQASGNVEVNAAQVKVTASMVTMDSAMVKCSGVVKCETLIATSVVGTSYTPGAGNIW